ncbi:unnamed protein product [Effrenium voratum]|uniref:BTB domain-containing protein n=1 Tax=Effrenium voratum TaxID=2562239 RepID=A0AA36NJD2_9DINO|nr:unnamed protein product [Effrenium voratum]
MPRATISVERLEFVVANPHTFGQGDVLHSPVAGPKGGFQCRLKVYPAGTHKTQEALSAFVELIAPPQMKLWRCEDVRFSIAVISSKSEQIRKESTFTFTSSDSNCGWSALVLLERLTIASGLLDDDSKVHLVASASNYPPQMDFSVKLKPAKILVPDGPPLMFDKRILVARSKYFATMLTSDFKESSTGVIDLREDPEASHVCMAAVLHFLLTASLDPNMDLELALGLHAMADKLCLHDLEKAVAELLKSKISDETLLLVLSQVFDTGSEVEQTCWQLLQEDCDLLHRQETQLDGIIQQDPALAKKLILFAANKKQKTR